MNGYNAVRITLTDNKGIEIETCNVISITSDSVSIRSDLHGIITGCRESDQWRYCDSLSDAVEFIGRISNSEVSEETKRLLAKIF